MEKFNYKKYFKGKKVTVMGLGLLGRGAGDAAFLAECGAELIVTDLKTKEQLKESLEKLKKFKSIRYVLGEHRLEDFRNRDFILKMASVPLDSAYIKEAKKNNIPVEMSAALFAKLSNLPIVGVTGTRGKSTVTHLIYHILKSAGKKVILGGNVRGVSNLQLLKQVGKADVSVLELDSWQLQGFGESKISPNISVFTNFMQDHLNYYKNNPDQYFIDKSYIYKFQKSGGALILGPAMKNKIKNVKSQILKANIKNIPKAWKISLVGKHNLENIACAIEAARFLKIKEEIIKKAIENFKAISGRLEFVREVNGIKIYNDNNSTTPQATIAALRALGTRGKNIILICGGNDKNLKLGELEKTINAYCRKVVCIPGTGTDKLKIESKKVKNLKEAVKIAIALAKRGDTLLFSPAFSSFSQYNNEYERGDQFMKIVRNLK